MLFTLMALALMASPESMKAIDALEALSHYGTLPECQRREEIVGTHFDHEHRFSPPEARFPGKANEFIPYTRHPDRRVVLRAARLLCFEGSAAARETLVALAARWPCVRELAMDAYALGDTTPGRCPGDPYKERGLPLAANASEVNAWPEAPDPKLLASLVALNPAAWDQAMASMTLLDRTRAQAVVKTLAALDTAPAIRKLLSASKVLTVQLAEGTLRDVFEGVAMLAIGALAQKQAQSPTEALLEVVRTATAADVPSLSELGLFSHRLLQGQGDAAKALLQKPGTTPEGRALLEKLVETSGSNRSQAWFDRSHQLQEWEQYRDRPALRAWAKDESKLHADRRAAAKVLAKLDDPSGLFLWESSTGLAEDEYNARRQDLSQLLREAQGPVYAAAKKLMDTVWSR